MTDTPINQYFDAREQARKAVEFHMQMKPGAPLHLVSIREGFAPKARTFSCDAVEDAIRFLVELQGIAGGYFHVAELKPDVRDIKAKKTDIAGTRILHVDIDCSDALERIRKFNPPPTVTIFSGGGAHAYWLIRKLMTDLALVERINQALARGLGGDNCHNVDRIMRLPFTYNIPNAKKRALGRGVSLAYVVDDLTDWSRIYNLEDFSHLLGGALVQSKPETIVPAAVSLDDLPAAVGQYTRTLIQRGDDPDKPVGTEGARFKSRSEALFYVACDLARAGCSLEVIAGVLLNPEFGISASVREKRAAEKYAARQAIRAHEVVGEGWPDVTEKGKPRSTLANTILAIRRLGILGEFDAFRRRKILAGHTLQSFHGELSDDGCLILREMIVRQFGFDPYGPNVREAANFVCLEDTHHPVRDYLDGLTWDGTPRIDTWLIDYLGADDTPINRAFGRIVLLAAIRRVRQPGVKFDYILVLEGKQGSGKSTAVQILAGIWFSDQDILVLDARGQMEALEGVWIYELGELVGLTRTDTNKLKAFASRFVDRGRLAFAHFREDRPRQNIFIGTTNEDSYLRDQTGNRRFWPVRTGEIHLERLEADRDQLWAEAAAREALRESIVLDPALWDAATQVQEERLEEDPWTAILEERLDRARSRSDNDHLVRLTVEKGVDVERVASSDLLSLALEIPAERQQQYHLKRLAAVMQKLGWMGPKVMKINGKTTRGYERRRNDDHA